MRKHQIPLVPPAGEQRVPFTSGSLKLESVRATARPTRLHAARLPRDPSCLPFRLGKTVQLS